MPNSEKAPLDNSALRAVKEWFERCELSEAHCRMHLSGTGAVAELEEKIRRYYGKRYALAVSSGTMGLLAVGLAMGLKDEEVVVPAYNYGASLSSWLMLGNRPVFADISREDIGLDPSSVRRVVTPSTKAILAADMFGIPSDTHALREIADEYGLYYVADAAQSLGARRGGLPASALADAIVVSFTAGKTLFAGEGGAVITDDRILYEKLVWFSQHPDRQKRELGLGLRNEFAVNGRINPLAAVWANATFEERLESLESHRRWCLEVIQVLNSTGLTEPADYCSDGIFPAFFRLTAAWKNKPRPGNLHRELEARGLSVRIEPPPARVVYREAAFLAQYPYSCKPHCPVAEKQARARFCLVKNTNP